MARGVAAARKVPQEARAPLLWQIWEDLKTSFKMSRIVVDQSVRLLRLHLANVRSMPRVCSRVNLLLGGQVLRNRTAILHPRSKSNVAKASARNQAESPRLHSSLSLR